MRLSEIKEQVMFQTNNDAEDVGDFLPSLTDYINEGYDRVVYVYAHQHVSEESDDYTPLSMESEEPNLPLWTHRAITDYATYLVYRNGNPQKQQRGMAYLQTFNETLAQIASGGGADGVNDDGTQKRYRKFINIPR